jgi:hypothetical protein
MNELELAKQLFENKENIILIYAFNATGKTRLSVAYKNFTKSINDGYHIGAYYNAFSEDLFFWENDEENDNDNIRLNILYSTLSQYHSFIEEQDIEGKLAIYSPKYKFRFDLDENPERGIRSITFFIDEENQTPIKISRGEERIFVWCFFLALFEVDVLATSLDAHFFIDDPVSSLDEHNIFLTAGAIFDLIKNNYIKKRIVITTHHIGLFSILGTRLKESNQESGYAKLTKLYVLSANNGKLELNSPSDDVFLFHLHLIKTLETAIKTELFAYHFVLLRQLLETISSFLGKRGFNYTLSQIGIEKEKVQETADIVNSLSHKNAYRLQFNRMTPAEEEIFTNIIRKIQIKYQFKY